MECFLSDYELIKLEYFQALKYKKNIRKGNIQAMTGLLTLENELKKCYNSRFEGHIEALRDAVSQINRYNNSEELHSELEYYIKNWRDGYYSITPIKNRNYPQKPTCLPPIENISKWQSNGFNLVSLYSGIFGLDLGFMGAGFNPLVALDINESSKKTIEANLPNLDFIKDDIVNISSKKVLDIAGLDVGELDLLTGGPPCQPFSTVGRRKGFSDPRASPLKEFIRFVKETKPKFFVMEEVTGLLSARIKHIPISERKGQKLTPEEMTGSVFKEVVDMLRKTGYNLSLGTCPEDYKYSILNAADYGTPQIRKRVIIIGSRVIKPKLPSPTHSNEKKECSNSQNLVPWNTFWDATCDLQSKNMEYSELPKKAKKYLPLVPPGGNWRNLPPNCIEEAMGNAYISGGGKTGYFRRLSWDFPCPTVTTAPTQAATLLCHPEELRPISVEEYKRVQGFPDDWDISGNTTTKYKLIGNAVPVHLSFAIAKQILELMSIDG